MPFDPDRLRETRKALKMSRRTLAAAVGTSVMYVGHMENGVRSNPAASLVESLAAALGCEMTDLMAPRPATDAPAETPATAEQPARPHDDKYRDWLILSVKWSRDELVWYASRSAGYTKNLLLAGRYTESEAKSNGRSHPGVLVAVHLSDAMRLATTWVTVANGTGQMAKLQALCGDRERAANANGN